MPAPDEDPPTTAPQALPADSSAERAAERDEGDEDAATFTGPPTVARLRKVRKSATFDTIGGPAMMVAMAWPIVGALANGAGALFWGLLAGVLFFFATAMASGMLEAAWGHPRASSLGYLLACLGASVLWIGGLPTWGLGAMVATSVAGLALAWRLESKRLRGGMELAEPVIEALMSLPEHLDAALQANVDGALAAHQQLHRTLATISPDEPLPPPSILAATADSALLALIRQTRRQVEVEAALAQGTSPELEGLKAEGRARLTEISRQIQGLRDGLLTLVVRRDPALMGSVQDKIEQLRLTARALDEVEAG